MTPADHFSFRCSLCGSEPREIPSRDGSLRGEEVFVVPRGETVLDLLIDSLMVVQRVALEAVPGPNRGEPALLTGALGTVLVKSVRLGVDELLDGAVPSWHFQPDGYSVKGLAHAGTLLRVRLENHTDQWCMVVAVAHGKIEAR